MTGRGHAALAVVSLGIAGLVIHAHAQATRQGDVQVRQLAYLKASNAEAGDHFGCGGVLDGHAGFGTALSGDGNTLVVGAPHEGSGARTVNGNQNDNSVDGAGAAYVFVRNGTNWVQQAYLKASNPSMNAEFGHAVAISADGSTIVVSAFWDPSKATGVNGDQNDQSIPQAGAAYVFTRRGTAWSQQAYLKASNTGEAGTADTFAEGDQFGFSVAISDDGNTVAIGAHSEDSNGVSGNQADNSMQLAGAVYVYTRTNATWVHTAYLKATNPDAGDMFGYSVSLSADGRTIAIGAFDEDGSFRGVNGPPDNARGGAGAVYIYAKPVNGFWSQQAYIHASNAEAGDSFGVHVVLSDDANTLLVGSLDEDCRATGVNPADPCDSDRAGDISTGAAYVFTRTGTTWSQQAFFKASNTGANDWFGSRLTLSGDGNTAAMGASLEDTLGRGINGNQEGDGATESGAVYLFTRRGTTWRQAAYIKASNTEAFDQIGSAVALSRDGRTLIATALGEDSSTRGVNGDQNDNSAMESGAAYVFGITTGNTTSF
jgi:trimeric autotransporter adhesin